VIRITDEITRITKGEFDVKLGNSSIYEIQKLYDALSRIVVSLKLAVLKVGTKKGLGLGKSLSSEDEMKLKFDVLFEASKDVVLIMGVDGTIRNVNRSVYDLVGYTKDEVEGKKFYDLKLLTPQTKKICIENFRKRLKGEDVPPYRVEFVRKDGKKVIGEITSSKLIMNKELIGFIVIVKEVKSFAS
ncbi:MAG: PAS domain S-box protein, partial [Candidatus Nanoarchaeia archaeon]